jgi:hypothetical protein
MKMCKCFELPITQWTKSSSWGLVLFFLLCCLTPNWGQRDGVNTTEPEIVLDAAAESSPAKVYIKTFWKYIAKLKLAKESGIHSSLNTNIRNASMALNNIKLKDAKYDIAPLQQELKQYEGLSETAAANVRDDRNNLNSASSFLSNLRRTDLLDFTNTGDLNSSIAAHDQKINAFKQGQEAFSASNPHPLALSQHESHFESKADNFVSHPEDIINQFSKCEYYDTGVGIYRHALSKQAYWQVLARLYPNNAKIQAASQAAEKVFSQLKKPEEMRSVFQQNKANRLKNTFMPPAAIRNEALENDFRRVFNGLGTGESIVKLNIRNREWYVIKNDLTGLVTARQHAAYILAKRRDGTCKLYELIIIQDHLATGYDQSRKDLQIVEHEFLCENVR